MRRLSLIVALALLALVPAAAAAAPTGTITLQPNRAGRGSTLSVDASPGASTSEQPQSVALLLARGGRFDSRARSASCKPSQASSSSCPAASRIGSGRVDGHASGLLLPPGGSAFSADLTLYLAPPPQTGDLAGIVIAYNSPSGLHGSLTARLLRVASGPFGSEILFSPPGAGAIPGVTVTLDRLRLTVGASRKVRVKRRRHHRRVHKTVTRNLITNPGSCSGSWPWQLRVAYASHQDVFDGSVACRAR